MERGYRKDLLEPFLELYGGSDSLEGLIREVVKYLDRGDAEAMVDLCIRKEEFESICWPTMPQSRPYVRIPWTEAWGFHYANILGGQREAERQLGGRDVEVESIGVGAVKEYPFFKLHTRITVNCVDSLSDEKVRLTFIDSIIERNGVFKVFLYKD